MKKVILTGGSDGLGEAFGKLCLENGIEVVSLSRSAPSYKAVHINTDLSSETSIHNAAKTIISNHGEFDALVNCAGVYSAQDPDDISYSELERILKINTVAPAYLISQLFDVIKTNNADIMNVGSTVGTKAYQNQLAYGASKWAMRGLSQNLQLELKETKCRVIQFNPGGFKSKLVQKFDGKDADLSKFMNPVDLATLMLQILQLPKSLEVSEILVNRK